MQQQPCQCSICLEQMATRRDTDSHFWNEFIEMLKDGRVQHIGNTAQGRPVYKDAR
jgi:hypothetical protein